MLCDWLVVNQVLPVNPAAAVRGPKHVVTKGATPVLSPTEARQLLDSIDPGTLAWIMHEEPILGETQEPPCGTNVVPTTF